MYYLIFNYLKFSLETEQYNFTGNPTCLFAKWYILVFEHILVDFPSFLSIIFLLF